MKNETAVRIVNFYAVFCWISAIAVILGSVVFFFIAEGWDALGALVLLIIAVPVAVFLFFLGRGLWLRRQWARIVVIALTLIKLVQYFLGIILAALFYGIFEFTVSDYITIGILAVSLSATYFFLAVPEIKILFTGQPQKAVKKK